MWWCHVRHQIREGIKPSRTARTAYWHQKNPSQHHTILRHRSRSNHGISVAHYSATQATINPKLHHRWRRYIYDRTPQYQGEWHDIHCKRKLNKNGTRMAFLFPYLFHSCSKPILVPFLFHSCSSSRQIQIFVSVFWLFVQTMIHFVTNSEFNAHACSILVPIKTLWRHISVCLIQL